jgi:alpha-1,2-mannosyltransferase
VWVALAVVAVGATAVVVLANRADPAGGLLDLRIYRLGAEAHLDGRSVYDGVESFSGLGFTYPPLLALVLAPFDALGAGAAEVAWTLLSLGSWWAGLWLLACRPGRRRPFVDRRVLLGVLAVSLAAAPFWVGLNYGQINAVLWLAIIVDLRSAAVSRRLAGVGSGLAASIKLVPAMVGVLYLLAGRWQAAVKAAAVAVAATAVGALLAWDDTWRFFTDTVFESSRVGDLGDASNASMRALLERSGVPESLSTALWVAVAVAVLALARRPFARALREATPISAVLLAGSVMALVSPVSWSHHLLFLAVALLLVVPAPGRRGLRDLVPALVVLLVLVDPIAGGRGSALSSTLWSAVMVGVVLLGDRIVSHEVGWRATWEEPGHTGTAAEAVGEHRYSDPPWPPST